MSDQYLSFMQLFLMLLLRLLHRGRVMSAVACLLVTHVTNAASRQFHWRDSTLFGITLMVRIRWDVYPISTPSQLFGPRVPNV